jgi:purine-binding chemotaxis protein CheW
MATAHLQAKHARDLIPSGQLVTFTLDGVEFGLDIDRVQEITPRTTMTGVPGAPSFVLGVVNLRGMIIPVLDSRLRFHLVGKPPTSKTRIIVLDLAGQPTGLQVDSVAEVVRLEDYTIRETPPLVAGVRSEYLAGMVTVGDRLITLINLEKILDSSEFSHRELLLENNASSRGLGAGMANIIEQEAIEEDLPYVTFALGKESFGISLQQVEEIIELPSITKVPDAPDYVLGVICLRDQVLPLLDIIRLLHVEETDDRSRDMVILLNLGESKLGIVVDGIQEIIRVREDSILPPPQTLGEEEAAKIEGIVIRPDRMVTLVKLLNGLRGEDHQRIAEIGNSLRGTGGEDIKVESRDLPLVVFRLGVEAYGLRLHEVREIIMAGQITPVPRAPIFIEGVLNLRGEVMPVLDLRARFGLPGQAATALSRIIISPISGVFTGLVVDAVDEVRNVDQRRLEDPPPVTTAGANTYIQKVARTDEGVIFILDIQQLLSDVEGQQLGVFQGRKKG